MRASSGSRLPLRPLQARQAVMQFIQLSLPAARHRHDVLAGQSSNVEAAAAVGADMAVAREQLGVGQRRRLRQARLGTAPRTATMGCTSMRDCARCCAGCRRAAHGRLAQRPGHGVAGVEHRRFLGRDPRLRPPGDIELQHIHGRVLRRMQRRTYFNSGRARRQAGLPAPVAAARSRWHALKKSRPAQAEPAGFCKIERSFVSFSNSHRRDCCRPTPAPQRTAAAGVRAMHKGQQTRAAILDAALTLASHMGLEGLSIGALAEVTQMSKSGVFAHFGSREELQISVIREYHARFEEEVFFPADPRSRAACRGCARCSSAGCAACRWNSTRAASTSAAPSSSTTARARCAMRWSRWCAWHAALERAIGWRSKPATCARHRRRRRCCSRCTA
jgi:AcrR family transcriptional regulator